MDIIVRVMRHVEIEDVADRGDIEAAGGDVGGDQQLGLAVPESVERGGARLFVFRTRLGLAIAAMVSALLASLAAVASAALAALAFARPAFADLTGLGRWRLAHPGNGLADQLLDGRDSLAVDRRDDGDGGAA